MKNEHKNNFGFLRLLLATLVIVSHSPEIIDQNRSREILTSIFGTISFGELAVDGFFLISGYLILKSYYASHSVKDYFYKRILRIYPAFVVASCICLLIVAPIYTGLNLTEVISPNEWPKHIFGMLTLAMPKLEHYPYIALNGSMWTIWIEFMCYVSIPVFYFLGLHNKKMYLLSLLVVAIIYLFTQITNWNLWLPYVGLDFHHSTRLLAAFLVGGVFHLYQDKIEWKYTYSLLAFIGLLISLHFRVFAEIGLFIFGGYLLFNFALNYKNKFLNSIGMKTDISYGVYLYAWPVQILILKYAPTINPHVMTLWTICLAATLGYLSWIFIEKPFIQLKKKVASTR